MRVQVGPKPFLEKDPFLPRLRGAGDITLLGAGSQRGGMQPDERRGFREAIGRLEDGAHCPTERFM